MNAWSSNVAEEGETCSVHVSRLVDRLISFRCRLCPCPSLCFDFVNFEFSRIFFLMFPSRVGVYSGRENSVGRSQGKEA